MNKRACLVAAVVLGAAAGGAASSALAQDTATTTVAGTTISVGGGGAYLTLPDVHYTIRYKNTGNFDTISKQTNDSFDDYGGGFSGSIATPFGTAFGMPWVGAVHGFWSNIDDSDRTRCTNTGNLTCAAPNILPEPPTASATGTMISRTNRDVDNWGAAFELTTPQQAPMILPGLFRNTHWGAAFDVRGIDQNLRIRGDEQLGALFNYRETLDTTYYGAYLTFGGEYSLFPSLYGSWGLRSFVDAHLGVYDASTDYNGRFLPNGASSTKLDLSQDDVAVIAGLKFETRKQISQRASLSLLSEYEWYSFVPDMKYNDGDTGTNGIINRTHIGDGDAFSNRTSLRLNIGLGPAALYPEPMK